jgi:hypothetical protein
MMPIQNPGLDLRDLVVEQVTISSLRPYQEADPADCRVDQDLWLDESGPGRCR